MDAARRIRRVLRNMLATEPFFSSLALRLPIVEDRSRKTIGSDGEHLFFNPQWIDETPADQIKTAICRCILACSLKHHTRRGDRDYGKWQQASKMVTLPMLRDAGLTEETGGMDDVSVEQAYKMLPDPEDGDDEDNEQEQPGIPPPGMPPPMAGAGSGGSPPPQGQNEDGDGEGGDGEGDGQQGDGQGGNSGQGQGNQGGGSGTGNAAPGDQPGSDQQPSPPESQDSDGSGEIMDSPKPEGKSDAEHESDLRKKEQDWDEAATQALQHAKAEGRSPGNLKEIFEDSHQSKIDWRTILRRFMTSTVKRDYSWSSPNRRFIADGLYLPSMKSESLAQIVVAVDTSASLSTEELSKFWSEIRSIVVDLEPESLTLIDCDTSVHSAETYHPLELPQEIPFHGRGGTMFTPVFDELERLPINPCCLIYFTDLYCSDYPAHEPPFPVMWASTEDHEKDGYYSKPPFGETLYIGDK